jgi:hypothetical protein
MRHGQTMRNYARAFFALGALVMVSACADNAVAPAAEVSAFVAPANFVRVGNVVTFRVNNAQGITKKLGAHVISIPAGAICDLSSGYGKTEWDKTCEPLKGSIVITATILQDSDQHPYVDFQPALRFSPSKEVMLFLKQGHNTAKRSLSVQYCNALAYCYDESLVDPSLKPFRVGHQPVIARRLKHFSGYVVVSGDICNGTITDNGDGTYWCEDGGMARRSGYMVASGEDISDVMKDDQDGRKKKIDE